MDTAAEEPQWNISVVSTVVHPDGLIKKRRLPEEELPRAHWTVMEHCDEIKPYVQQHDEYMPLWPNTTLHQFVECFNKGFRIQVSHPLNFKIYNFLIYILHLVN